MYNHAQVKETLSDNILQWAKCVNDTYRQTDVLSLLVACLHSL